jgi:Family of unknown function (DUF5675)
MEIAPPPVRVVRRATLTREHSTRPGIFGRLEFDGQVLFTAELPWLNNATNKSCIPAGEYRIRPRWFNQKGYLAIGIDGVPGRSNILIHRGNHPSEVRGCVLVGLSLELEANRIASSKIALDRLLAWLDGGEARLTIRFAEDFPAP